MSDVVIVGAGIIGLSTARWFVERGVTDVTVVDRDGIASGGTGKSAAIIRCHYGVTSVAGLALESLSFFEHAEDIVGQPIGFEKVGYLVAVGPENVEPFQASLANQRSLGIETEDVDHAEVAKLWPTARLDDFAAFCFEPRGGYGDGYATAQALASHLRARGVTIRQGSPVTQIVAESGKATGVRLANGEVLAAGRVIVAAGAWSVPLLATVGIDLPIKPLFVEEVLIDPGEDLGALPVFSDLVSRQYVHLRGRELLFGNSDRHDTFPPLEDPDVYSHHASAGAVEATAEKAMHRFPGLAEQRLSGTNTGVIDATPDHNPIVSDTEIDGLFVAAGMSGHGFKISLGIGRMAAEMVLDEKTTIAHVELEDFKLSRFEAGQLLVSPYAYSGVVGIR